jgi:hypothetical protein
MSWRQRVGCWSSSPAPLGRWPGRPLCCLAMRPAKGITAYQRRLLNAFGPNHPVAVRCANDPAVTLHAFGKYERACGLLKHAHATYLSRRLRQLYQWGRGWLAKRFGAAHPTTRKVKRLRAALWACCSARGTGTIRCACLL